MEIKQGNVELLNDLIQINCDRITGYKKAILEIGNSDPDLRSFFGEMANISSENVAALRKYVHEEGGHPADKSATKGEIYRGWMSLEVSFSGNDRKAILDSCEFGEGAAQKAYDLALESGVELPNEIRKLIKIQKTGLKMSLMSIKRQKKFQSADHW